MGRAGMGAVRYSWRTTLRSVASFCARTGSAGRFEAAGRVVELVVPGTIDNVISRAGDEFELGFMPLHFFEDSETAGLGSRNSSEPPGALPVLTEGGIGWIKGS